MKLFMRFVSFAPPPNLQLSNHPIFPSHLSSFQLRSLNFKQANYSARLVWFFYTCFFFSISRRWVLLRSLCVVRVCVRCSMDALIQWYATILLVGNSNGGCCFRSFFQEPLLVFFPLCPHRLSYPSLYLSATNFSL